MRDLPELMREVVKVLSAGDKQLIVQIKYLLNQIEDLK